MRRWVRGRRSCREEPLSGGEESALGHERWCGALSDLILASPLLGFGLALVLFRGLKRIVHDRHLYEPPKEGQVPVWWMRALLVLTCTGVSFAHGTNDGQKSIGLIMLTIIGLFPATYAVNPQMTHEQVLRAVAGLPKAADLIARHGDDEKEAAVQAHTRSVSASGR